MERRAFGVGRATDLAATLALDLRPHARLRVEELLLDLRPAADVLIVKSCGRTGKLSPFIALPSTGRYPFCANSRCAGSVRRNFRNAGPLSLVAGVRRHRDRVLDQDGRLRDHELDRLSLPLREEGFVLVAEEDVATAREERLQALARASSAGRRRASTASRDSRSPASRLARAECAAVGGHDVPACASRGNGLGVITWTPGLSRTSQLLSFFGLPSRTTNTTTERVTIPFHLSLFQLGATSFF